MRDITGGSVVSTGTVDTSQSEECTFDAEATAVLMQILSNQYSDKHLAILREYVCNARDEHVETGNTAPIRVTLPTPLQPTLVVEDEGSGLSKDGIFKIFGTYGKSTKRDSNKSVGGYGIGSKAAFTMGTSFVVIGRKDGQETTVLFALNERGIGTKTVLAEGPTVEPNGVTVQLPVQDPSEMERTARKFFRTWQRGTVLVDGVEPDNCAYDKGFEVTDTIRCDEDSRDVTVVMGFVGYPVSKGILQKVERLLGENAKGSDAHRLATNLAGWSPDFGLLIDVPIGSIDHTPSRESLMDTAKTVDTLALAVMEMAEELQTRVKARVDACATHYEAATKLVTERHILKAFAVSVSSVTWRGRPLGALYLPWEAIRLVKNSTRYNARRVTERFGGAAAAKHNTEARQRQNVKRNDKLPRYGTDQWHPSVDVTAKSAMNHEYVVITDVPVGDENKVTRFAKRFLDNEPDNTWLMWTDRSKGAFEWFNFGPDADIRSMTLAEFKDHLKTLAPSRPAKVRLNEPSYSMGYSSDKDIYDRTPLSEILEDCEDRGTPLVYFEDDDDAPYESALVRDCFKDYTVITLLPTQSAPALLKRVPNALHGRPMIAKHAQAIWETKTQDDTDIRDRQAFEHCSERNDYDRFRVNMGTLFDQIVNEEFLAPFKTLAASESLTSVERARMDLLKSAASWLGKAWADKERDLPNLDRAWPTLVCLTGHRYHHRENEGKRARKQALAMINALAAPVLPEPIFSD